MKTRTAFLSFAIWIVAFHCHAVTIAQWTFESPPDDLPNSTASPTVAANVGTGSASGLHASAASDWTTPAGNGSENSFNANNWAVGDYYQFQVGTVGFQNIVVAWDQNRSSTGPATFDFAWSLNGVDFTVALDDYAVSTTSWSSGTHIITTSFSVLGLPSDLDNASALYFRTTAVSAPGGTGGASRIDNFTVSGTVKASVPDPGTSALLLGISLSGLLLFRRISARVSSGRAAR